MSQWVHAKVRSCDAQKMQNLGLKFFYSNVRDWKLYRKQFFEIAAIQLWNPLSFSTLFNK